MRGFDEAIWERHREEIVTEGTRLKYRSSDKLRQVLLGTADRSLIEANPADRIWGIGFDASSAMANKRNWGQNLMGKALEKVREELRRE